MVPTGTFGKLPHRGHRDAGVTSALTKDLKLSHEDMQVAAGACDSNAQTIISAVGSMMNVLDQTEAQWHGKAGTTFGQVKQVMRTELNNIVDALEDLSTALKSGDAQMSDADDVASGKLQSAIEAALTTTPGVQG